MSKQGPEQVLRAGAAELGLALPDVVLAALCGYVDLLHEWSQRYNLTAVRDPDAMLSRHLLDSLAVVPNLHGTRVLDVGTGAGLPGIPLALACPHLHFVLLDSNGKKIRFVTHAVAMLGLKNVEIVQARVEDYRPAELFATVTSRAFASLEGFLRMAGHLCFPDGRWLAMKGAPSEDELRGLLPGFRLVALHPLRVPGLDAKRCVVEIEKSEDARREA